MPSAISDDLPEVIVIGRGELILNDNFVVIPLIARENVYAEVADRDLGTDER